MIKKLSAWFYLIQKQKKLHVISILILTAIFYIPVFNNLLTNWDDDHYILLNPFIERLSLVNIKEMFTSLYAGNYHPLTLFSLALNYKMGGIEPWPYQLTNLILHLFNTLFVYIFVTSILKSGSQNTKTTESSFLPLFVAFIFGIHTIQVESVAWVSERKNVLYSFFFLLSLINYIKYLKTDSYKNFSLALLLFIFSLLSKGMAIPLTICLVCIDYFAGRNILSRKVILEKVPFIALSLIFGIVAIFAQQSEKALYTGTNFNYLDRISFACYGFFQYLVKLCYPFHLSAFYPYPVKHDILPYSFYVCILFVALLFIIIWRYFRNNKIVVFGALFFLANIIMVIQLLPVGDAIIADRYAYLPAIGFFLIVGYGAAMLMQGNTLVKYTVISFIALYSLILGYKTYHRVEIWKDSLTLWNDAIKNYPENNDRGYLNRANSLQERGDYENAFLDYQRLLKIRPKNVAGYLGMGHLKYSTKDLPGALDYFNKALLLQKTYQGFISRTVVKADMHDYEGALADADSACQLNPASADAFLNKGFIYFQTGNYSLALENYTKALQLDSLNSKAYKGRALTKKAMNNPEGALYDLNNYLSLTQTYDGYGERAIIKMALADYSGAKYDLYSALQLNRNCAEIYMNLGIIELNSGNNPDAIKNFDMAAKIDTTNYQVYINRAVANLNLANYSEAIVDLNLSVKIQASADAFYYRGFAFHQLGEKQTGCSDLKQSMLMGNTAAKDEWEKNCK